MQWEIIFTKKHQIFAKKIVANDINIYFCEKYLQKTRFGKTEKSQTNKNLNNGERISY